MNYRHAYHAGSFADVFKHLCLVALLRGLSRKDNPWAYLDTHAGAGMYDLASVPAQKTGEYRQGIGRLWLAPGPFPPALADYLAVLRSLVGGKDAPHHYPGSPLIAAAVARPQDRVIACELNPLEYAALCEHAHPAMTVHNTDGYHGLKAFLPPIERRGLVLIDPPYEDATELARLPRELLAAHRRFATGCYALWYPLKDEGPLAGLKRSLQDSGLRRLLLTELRLTSLVQGGILHGCGLLVINPPWGFVEQMQEALPALANILAPGSGATGVEWLVPE